MQAAQGIATGAGGWFDRHAIDWVRRRGGLKSLRERLRDEGMITTAEMARRLGLCEWSVRDLRARGQHRGRMANDRGAWMFELPTEDVISYIRRADAATTKSPAARPVAIASPGGGAA